MTPIEPTVLEKILLHLQGQNTLTSIITMFVKLFRKKQLYCPMSEMVADILTKPLARGQFETLLLATGMEQDLSN